MPRVYVGRLSYHVREKDIQRFFSGYGKLLEIDLKNGYVWEATLTLANLANVNISLDVVVAMYLWE